MGAMCRVLVAEDEYLMQQGIKYLMDWEQEGFILVGENIGRMFGSDKTAAEN